MPIKPSPPRPLGKNEIFEYFKYGICDRDPQKKSSEKILLVLDLFVFRLSSFSVLSILLFSRILLVSFVSFVFDFSFFYFLKYLIYFIE